MRASILVLLAGLVAQPCVAFNGHRVESGDLVLEIGEFEPPSEAGKPVKVPVKVINGGGRELGCRLELHGLVDEWQALGETTAKFTLPVAGTVKHEFGMVAGAGVERALYPVHVTARVAGGPELHAVRVFESKIPKEAAAGDGAIEVVAGGTLDLLDPALSEVVWRSFDGGETRRARGWTGADEKTGNTRAVQTVDRGGMRRAIVMHPPYRGMKGTVGSVFSMRLPKTKPLGLSFANAVRDPDPGQTGDGVTFRVRIDGEVVFDRHSDSRRWVEERVDLDRWAGRRVSLELESDPGPERNTAFDSSYWGAPMIRSGPAPRVATGEEAAAAAEKAKRQLAGGGGAIDLGGGARAALVAGPNGWIDGSIGFGIDGCSVGFAGIDMEIDGSRLGTAQAACRVLGFERRPLPHGGAVVVHRCQDGRGEFDLLLEARPEGGGLRLHVDAPRRITRFAMGCADRSAERVYAGHGYVIEKPERFRLGYGGHSLAASHVAADYEGGLSLLTASDHPPVAFEVDPEMRRYSLVARYDATLTFVPGSRGGLETALRYRPLYDKPAAAGVAAKAGRFVLDIWGGRYADATELMRRAIDYGLSDSMLTMHVWQRWGYDYRLPDIFPPDPQLGTMEDMRELAGVCRGAGIPWGLHDNYIDFYPDAEGYSYENICFSENGEPVKAWLNEGRDARSYRWRPDRFEPFLRRNMELIASALEPTHSFVDVFTSIPPVEFHDRQGNFHSALETRRCWAEAFDLIRSRLKGPAITTSEAGHDQLTGHLDGADCQFLRLTDEDERFCIRIGNADWERVPWMDAVLHDRFIQHGVGYSGRYQGGRDRRNHGIESDDYLSAEILTGHALMVDRAAGLQGAARKYWLAQPVARALAMDTIAEAGWEDGNLHRQTVRWSRGMKVRVNRGDDDWNVDGRVLPRYGFVAANGEVEAAVERIGGYVVEHSRWPGGIYVNARTMRRRGDPLQVRVHAGEFTAPDRARFRLPIRWSVGEVIKEDALVFLHVLAADDPGKIIAQGDHKPKLATGSWQGEVMSGEGVTVRLPDGLAAGRYPVVVGLHVPGGVRLRLEGKDVGSRSYLLGDLVADGGNGEMVFERSLHEPQPSLLNPRGTMVDFGPVVTDGAFRMVTDDNGTVLTSLPDVPAMNVIVRIDEGLAGRRVRKIEVVDAAGRPGGAVPFVAKDGTVSLRTRVGDFGYRIVPER